MRKIGGGLATLESEGCLSVVGFCIKHEGAPRKPERVVERVGAARCCVKRRRRILRPFYFLFFDCGCALLRTGDAN